MYDNAKISLLSRRPDFDEGKCDVSVAGINFTNLKLAKKALLKLRFPQYIFLALLYKITGKYFTSDRLVVANAIWNEYCHSDVIITGLDDSFSTLYGTAPFYTTCFDLMLGKLLNKKVVLLGGSVGPFKNKRFELLAKSILDEFDLITLREDLSFEYLKRIGIKNPAMHVTADLSFQLDPASTDRIAEIMKYSGIADGPKPLIGVCFSRVISKWAFPEITDNWQKYDKYVVIVAGLLDDLIERTEATIVFLPQVTGPCEYYDDRTTHKFIWNHMKKKDETVLINEEYTAGELQGIIGKCDFFIGTRIQSQISSVMMSVPLIALEYESFSTRGIIGRMIGYEESIININELDQDTVLTKILDCWQRRRSIKNGLSEKATCINDRKSMNDRLLLSII